MVEQTFGSVKKAAFTWLSAAGGAADGATVEAYNGEILRAVFIPDGGGTQPSDLYDVALNDDDGVNVLGGEAGDLSNAVIEQLRNMGAVANSKLTLAVTNGGNAKGGKVIVYIR